MQKKELRKSWRRKLAGLLAGTLIAGVFGISMPMTAKAAPGDGDLNLSKTAIEFAEQTEYQMQTAMDTITLTCGDTDKGTFSNLSVTSGTDAAASVFKVDVPSGDITKAQAKTITIEFKPFTGGNIPLDPNVLHTETFTVKGTYTPENESAGAEQPLGTFTASVILVDESYGFEVGFEDGNTTVQTNRLDFDPLDEGYKYADAAGVAKKVFVTNNSTEPVSFIMSPLADETSVFDVSGDSLTNVAPGTIAELTFTPKLTLEAMAEPHMEDFSFRADGLDLPAEEFTAYVTVKPATVGWEVSPTTLKKIDLGTEDDANHRVSAAGELKNDLEATVTINNLGASAIRNMKAEVAAFGDLYTITCPNGIAGKKTASVKLGFAKKNLEAGDYATTLTISADGMDDIVLPVTLTLYDETYTLAVTEEDANGKDVAVTAINLGELGEDYDDSTVPSKTIKVTNNGNTNTTISAVLTGDGAKALKVEPAVRDVEIISKKSTNVIVKAAPKQEAGDYSADLVITNHADDTETTIPVTFSVKENTYAIDVVDDKNAAVTSVAFEKKIENGYSFKDEEKRTLFLKNTGNSPVYVKATPEHANNKNGFATLVSDIADLDGTVKGAVPVGEKFELTDILPELKLDAGTYTTTVKLEVYDNEKGSTPAPVKKAEKTVTFTFEVEKENIAISVRPANYDFGPLPGGFEPNVDVEAKTITVTNTGNKDVTFDAPTTINGSGSWKSGVSSSKFQLADAKGLEAGNTLKVGKSATLTIVPVKTTFQTGTRPVNDYDEDLTLTAKLPNSDKTATAKINATFSVTEAVKSIEVKESEVTLELPEGFTQSEAEAAAKEIEVSNTGNIAIEMNLSNIVNGTFFKVEKPDGEALKNIAPGESVKVKVWAKTGSTAPQEKEMTINYKDGKAADAKKVVVKLVTVERVRKIEADKTALSFKEAEEGYTTQEELKVTIKNTGNGEVTITPPTGKKFEVTADGETKIAAGQEATFTVKPAAGLAAGAHTEALAFKAEGCDDVTVNASFTVNAKKSGWKKESDGWYYYKDGAAAKGWLKTGGKWYFLDKSTGLMKTGWLKDDGKWYYLKASGAMASNEWVKDGGKYYFFKSGGAMASAQWVSWKGDWYYMNAGGSMKTEGWTKSAGKWYYMGKDGKMVKSTSVTVKGKKYNFDKNGVCTNP